MVECICCVKLYTKPTVSYYPCRLARGGGPHPPRPTHSVEPLRRARARAGPRSRCRPRAPTPHRRGALGAGAGAGAGTGAHTRVAGVRRGASGGGWGAQGLGMARWVRGRGRGPVAEKSCILPKVFRSAQKQPITHLRGRWIQRLNHGGFRWIRMDSSGFGHFPPKETALPCRF